MAQNKRERVIKSFRDGSISVLVATDVAARGLDIEAVDLVINYDAPMDPDTYVHRIGRTGRAGAEGTSISFFLDNERGMMKEIERRTGKPIEPLDLEVVRRPEPEVPRPPARPRTAGGRGPRDLGAVRRMDDQEVGNPLPGRHRRRGRYDLDRAAGDRRAPARLLRRQSALSTRAAFQHRLTARR